MLMTLENTLLQKLSEWQAPAGRQELHVATAGWRATVIADRSDALGCLLWELNLQREGTADVDIQSWAANVAERVTGLIQPLKVIEVDQLRKEAQLRSDIPSVRGDKRCYHELILSALGRAVLRRFQSASGETGRSQMVFAITHEALARLAGDVAAAAD
jgi:hypothetical protein